MNRRQFLKTSLTLALAMPFQPDLAASVEAARGLSSVSFQGDFDLPDQVLARLLSEALSLGGDRADLFFQHYHSTSIVLEDGVVNRAGTGGGLGLGVRVLVGERTGYAFCQDFSPPVMIETARQAARLARAGRQPDSGPGKSVGRLQGLVRPDFYPMARPWSENPPDLRVEMLKTAGQKLKKSDPRLVDSNISWLDSETRVLIVDSRGFKREDVRPRFSVRVSAVAEQNGSRVSDGYGLAFRAGLEGVSEGLLETVVDQAVEKTLRQFEARPVSPGETPVVLAPGSSGILLHEAIGHGLEGDANRSGRSAYAGSLGQRVAPEQVTIVDDGTIPGNNGSLNFDDEGEDSRRTVLVEKGILKSYLHDRLSAAHFRTESTGSARRQSYRFRPMPRMRVTLMEAGEFEPGEIIASVKKGLYAETFSNGQVDTASGAFSFYVKSGWAIEDGRLTHPVADVNLIGSGPEVLNRIKMVGRDPALHQGGGMCSKAGQQVPVGFGLPTVLVSSINVGGSGS